MVDYFLCHALCLIPIEWSHCLYSSLDFAILNCPSICSYDKPCSSNHLAIHLVAACLNISNSLDTLLNVWTCTVQVLASPLMVSSDSTLAKLLAVKMCSIAQTSSRALWALYELSGNILAYKLPTPKCLFSLGVQFAKYSTLPLTNLLHSKYVSAKCKFILCRRLNKICLLCSSANRIGKLKVKPLWATNTG